MLLGAEAHETKTAKSRKQLEKLHGGRTPWLSKKQKRLLYKFGSLLIFCAVLCWVLMFVFSSISIKNDAALLAKRQQQRQQQQQRDRITVAEQQQATLRQQQAAQARADKEKADK